ncbi:MAG: AAA family ATPase [Spirochaetales bacterium]|nr:AAA family ATPase [Spirochaetales bacterium]
MTLKEKVEKWMASKGVTQSGLASRLGMSGAAVSLWLHGKYAGDLPALEEKLEKLLELEEERDKGVLLMPEKFVPTTGARKYMEAARLAHRDGSIRVCYGDAGLGKTWAGREYARQNPGTIFIEASADFSPRVLLQEILMALGREGRGTNHAMRREICDVLRNSRRLLIVDEAENLPYRSLEILRRIYDETEIGILLAGMPRLLANLKGKRGDFKQLYSRIAGVFTLDKLSEEDVRLILEARLGEVDEKSAATFHYQSNANGRTLKFLMSETARLCQLNDRSVAPVIIEKAASLLLRG